MHSLVKLELVDVTDALLGRKDALRACDLIADKLGKEAGQLDINGSIRSSELRKKLYEKFGIRRGPVAVPAPAAEEPPEEKRKARGK